MVVGQREVAHSQLTRQQGPMAVCYSRGAEAPWSCSKPSLLYFSKDTPPICVAPAMQEGSLAEQLLLRVRLSQNPAKMLCHLTSGFINLCAASFGSWSKFQQREIPHILVIIIIIIFSYRVKTDTKASLSWNTRCWKCSFFNRKNTQNLSVLSFLRHSHFSQDWCGPSHIGWGKKCTASTAWNGNVSLSSESEPLITGNR